jgi:hypothetical protein
VEEEIMDSWILHQDSVQAHNALAMKQLLANKCIPVLKPSPPHSPDLTPCDFYLFPKLKCALKELIFSL